MKLNREYLDQFDNLRPILQVALRELETHYELFVSAAKTGDTELLTRSTHTLRNVACHLENHYLTQSLTTLYQAIKDNNTMVAKTQIVMVNDLVPLLIECVREDLSTLQ